MQKDIISQSDVPSKPSGGQRGRGLERRPSSANKGKVHDFATLEPPHDQSPKRSDAASSGREIVPADRQQDLQKEHKKLSQRASDLRQTAKQAAQQMLELQTSLTKFQKDMEEIQFIGAQIENFRQFKDFLGQKKALPLENLEPADKLLQTMIDHLSTTKKDLEVLRDLQQAQQDVDQSKQQFEGKVREGHQFNEDPDEIRKRYAELSERAEVDIKQAEANTKNTYEIQQKCMDESWTTIKSLKSENDELIETCGISRDRKHRRVKIEHPEKLFPEEFETLQNDISQIENQIRTLEDKTSQSFPETSGKSDEAKPSNASSTTGDTQTHPMQVQEHLDAGTDDQAKLPKTDTSDSNGTDTSRRNREAIRQQSTEKALFSRTAEQPTVLLPPTGSLRETQGIAKQEDSVKQSWTDRADRSDPAKALEDRFIEHGFRGIIQISPEKRIESIKSLRKGTFKQYVDFMSKSNSIRIFSMFIGRDENKKLLTPDEERMVFIDLPKQQGPAAVEAYIQYGKAEPLNNIVDFIKKIHKRIQNENGETEAPSSSQEG